MLKVKDIMTPNPVTVRVDSPLREAAGLLRKYHIGGLPVMDGDRVVAVSAIDNLVKGASGQAIQNMNLMCGFAEGAGLCFAGMSP